ncbi:MAG: hypothetical protein IKC89_07120, partial [Lentisphaeria bacterium]|nr:hypothetical protein [Lentisphaeria bacterium]
CSNQLSYGSTFLRLAYYITEYTVFQAAYQLFYKLYHSFLQKISLRRRESRLAARASHSTVAVDFPETSLCGIPRTFRRPHNCG